MRKFLIIFIVCFILIAALAMAMLWQTDYGYVQITNGTWNFENTLTRSIVIAIPILLLIYIVFRACLKIWRIPKILKHFKIQRSSERARRNVINGLIELTEGHWQKAEQMLMRDIQNSDTPLLNYLLAARAAQQQDADERRDAYLKKAHEVTPKADVAIGLTQAELQLAHEQNERALATLTQLREIAPKHPYVLKLLSRLHVRLNEWEKLAPLLPEIRKYKILSGDKLLELERTTYKQFIHSISKSSAVMTLEGQWKLIPKRYREDAEIFRVYINCLLKHNNTIEAEKLLRLYLNKSWQENLIQLYGQIHLPDGKKQLDQAEAWLKDHGRSPMLLLTLGRLSNHLRLWGKARVYFESSLGIHPTIEAYSELAELLESLGETDSAHEHYRKGLALATSRSYTRRATDLPTSETLIVSNKDNPATNQVSDSKNVSPTKLAAVK